MVIKKNGSRELFDRSKVMSGLMKACEKRPVSPMALERVVNRVDLMVQENPDREVHSVEIGKLLLSELRDLDKVAYLRFASVYLEFEDVSEFLREVNTLITRKT